MKIGDIFESAEGIMPQEALDLCIDGVSIQEVEPIDGFIDKEVIDTPPEFDEKTGKLLKEATFKTIKVEAKIRRFQIVAPPEPTAEELATQALAQAKSERANAVENITVEVEGMIFQGDETSQLRIARAIIALEDGERITWVLADDTIVKVTKEQLKQVLRKAGEKQTELWTKPYEE